MIPKGLANAIVVLVSLVWVGNFVASITLPGYQTDSSINFVFMTIVGGALALRRNPTDGTGVIERLSASFKPNTPKPPPDGPENPT